jgi:ABC-type nitrate/sulfonate/bicarbonate transport system permease component
MHKNSKAQTGRLRQSATPAPFIGPVGLVRIAIVLALLALWEGLARSGLLYRDVVPSFIAIGQALYELLAGREFYFNLGVTATEISVALVPFNSCGMVVGIILGANPFLSKAFESLLYYLGPTPKIIFFPVMIMWFGVGPESKVALGTLSCFFPVALSVAAGMRQIDGALIRVGRSFRANTRQMVTKIYLPAMRHPIINGARLGLGVALIGTLLAETKLSNKGIGFLIIQAYSVFDMPRMYAMLIALFVLAIGANALVGRLGGLHSIKRV